MTAQVLLDRLDAVISTSGNTWRARCPAHGSKGRTLAVKEAEDGTVLVKCFAECDVLEVLGAVGLEMGDLFPEPLPKVGRREYFPVADVMRCLTQEMINVKVIAEHLKNSPLSAEGEEILNQSIRRIDAGVNVCRV